MFYLIKFTFFVCLAHLWGAYAIPLASVIKLWLENQIFTFLTSSLQQPAGVASYYARRLPIPRPS